MRAGEREARMSIDPGVQYIYDKCHSPTKYNNKLIITRKRENIYPICLH